VLFGGSSFRESFLLSLFSGSLALLEFLLSLVSKLLSLLYSFLLALGTDEVRDDLPSVAGAGGELVDPLGKEGNFILGPLLFLLLLSFDLGLFLSADSGLSFSLRQSLVESNELVNSIGGVSGDRIETHDDSFDAFSSLELFLNGLDPEAIVVSSTQFLCQDLVQLFEGGLPVNVPLSSGGGLVLFLVLFRLYLCEFGVFKGLNSSELLGVQLRFVVLLCSLDRLLLGFFSGKNNLDSRIVLVGHLG